MLARLKTLLQSRKFQVFLAGVIIWSGRQLGLDISFEDAVLLLSFAGLLIFGIALEDFGAKRAGSAPVQPPSTGEPAAVPVAAPTPADASYALKTCRGCSHSPHEGRCSDANCDCSTRSYS